MSNIMKEEKVYDMLTRYGITDRRVAVTERGVMVHDIAERKRLDLGNINLLN